MRKLKIGEFLKQYCSDIMELYEKYKNSDILYKDYDEIIDDDDGYPIKVVWVDGHAIDIEHFFSMDDDDFSYTYSTPNALKAREQYLSKFTITDGFEAFFEELIKIQEEKKKIEEDIAKYSEVISSASAIPTEEGSALAGRLYSGGF